MPMLSCIQLNLTNTYDCEDYVKRKILTSQTTNIRYTIYSGNRKKGNGMKTYKVCEVFDRNATSILSSYGFIVEAEDNATDDEIMEELGKVNFWKMEKVSDGIYTNEYHTSKFAVDRG